MNKTNYSICIFCILLTANHNLTSATWNQWWGPGRGGSIPTSQPLSESISKVSCSISSTQTRKKFKLLEELRVTDHESWAHLGMDGKQIFVRHMKGIQCFTWEWNYHYSNPNK